FKVNVKISKLAFKGGLKLSLLLSLLSFKPISTEAEHDAGARNRLGFLPPTNLDGPHNHGLFILLNGRPHHALSARLDGHTVQEPPFFFLGTRHSGSKLLRHSGRRASSDGYSYREWQRSGNLPLSNTGYVPMLGTPDGPDTR
uniref:Attacin C-terminal domain-containing protein n=1 Tax=Glossina austeni TaxID=7395 RepID=A0A1A9VHW6_GLOAU